MSGFSRSNRRKPFVQPDSPFLLLTEDIEGNVSYCWWDDEEGLQEDAAKKIASGEQIICASEIASYRDVEIAPQYTVDDFFDEVTAVYDEALRRKLDSFVLAIETDTERIYYINSTKDGFQCDEFDNYFDNLESIANILFNEKMVGKPAEIRIEQTLK